MAGEAKNRLDAFRRRVAGWTFGEGPGDLPEGLVERYASQTALGAPIAFFTDVATKRTAFRDHGGRLSTERSDPQIIVDLLRIAQHRGWTSLAVRGEPAFRREVWLQARLAGLQVRGYRAAAPERRALEQQLAGQAMAPGGRDDRARPAVRETWADDPGVRSRLKVVEAVVRGRLADPAAQAQLIEAARTRLAAWLTRGARFEPLPSPPRAPELVREPQRRRGR
ncbi:MAG: hypothetical protein IT546_06005 [Caulobacteraceae bacterium]|nr:hypothetical protein [Caulobacteraceae bacterium]